MMNLDPVGKVGQPLGYRFGHFGHKLRKIGYRLPLHRHILAMLQGRVKKEPLAGGQVAVLTGRHSFAAVTQGRFIATVGLGRVTKQMTG